MKRIKTLMKWLLLVTLFTPLFAQNGNVTVVSDSNWNVFRPNPTPTPATFLGLAENVCLNATSPMNCLIGVTPQPISYGYPFNGWTAASAGARWIWAPMVTAASSPAALQVFIFETDFYVCDPPLGGT